MAKQFAQLKKIKKHFYLVLDIETANFTEDALAYDVGIAIIDRYGRVYAKFSFVCYDIFELEKELMKYKEKEEKGE